jgi:hypothetical protein
MMCGILRMRILAPGRPYLTLCGMMCGILRMKILAPVWALSYLMWDDVRHSAHENTGPGTALLQVIEEEWEPHLPYEPVIRRTEVTPIVAPSQYGQQVDGARE